MGTIILTAMHMTTRILMPTIIPTGMGIVMTRPGPTEAVGQIIAPISMARLPARIGVMIAEATLRRRKSMPSIGIS